MIETGDIEFEGRAVAPEYSEADTETEFTLRPQTLQEYIGQDKVKENLAVYIEAAKRRGEPLDHVLLYGPPGLGKTTLAGIIAHEMGANLRITTGPAIEKPGDLAALLTNLSANDVLFIDEIHRLSRAIEEILYPALEDNALDIVIGKGPSARSIRVDVPHFSFPSYMLYRNREYRILTPYPDVYIDWTSDAAVRSSPCYSTRAMIAKGKLPSRQG